MVICFEVDRDTKDKMDRMVRDGDYRDYSELLSITVANQFLFHISKEGDTGNDPRTLVAIEPTVEIGSRFADTHGREVSGSKALSSIPQIFATPLSSSAEIQVAPLPNDAFAMGMEVSADRWIFGQHNKLLPAKANVRALANLLGADPKHSSLELEAASRQIANEASRLGDVLRNADTHSKRSRDESLALAFPSSEPANSDKSRLRYASQFVGSVSKEGKMTGLLVDLKFINVDRTKPPHIRLTEPGRRFAEMRNPILDDINSDQLEKFSEDEVDFLLGHVTINLPVENFAYSVTLGAISAGSDTPESLDLALQKFLPKRKEKPFTSAFLTTQRAGVISRMADLGLVTRSRSGPNVTYVVTERGEKFTRKGAGK